MNGTPTIPGHLWKGPALVWGGLVVLFAVTTASAYVPLGAFNTALNLLIAAVMILLLVTFLMNLRRSSTLLHLLAGAGLFWSIFMFALTFADYATRHY
jgi:cytochrome c oxidase subunit IV